MQVKVLKIHGLCNGFTCGYYFHPCPTAKIHVNLTDRNHTTDDNLEGNKETNTDYISYQLFILLQVKLLKTAN